MGLSGLQRYLVWIVFTDVRRRGRQSCFLGWIRYGDWIHSIERIVCFLCWRGAQVGQGGMADPSAILAQLMHEMGDAPSWFGLLVLWIGRGGWKFFACLRVWPKWLPACLLKKLALLFLFVPPPHVVDCNPGAIFRRTCLVAALVLFTPARSLSNCDGIVWGFGIAQGLVGLCEDFVVVGPVGWR